MEYGLIGKRLGHSYSKQIHEQIAPYTYELHALEESELPAFLRARAFRAVNVTIPYKEAVLPFLDSIDERAKAIGAVNTIVQKDGKLIGCNTDYDGLLALLHKKRISLKGKNVLILGTGGTAKTAHAAAQSQGAKSILHVTRQKKAQQAFDCITYAQAKTQAAAAQVIINTTPVGMYPHEEETPLDLADFPGIESVVDVIYHPLRTDLVLQAKERGILASGGLFMLCAQAVFASDLFLGKTSDAARAEEVYQTLCMEKQNIVLCGMPTSGKSTVAKALAKRLQKEAVDTDDLFTQIHDTAPAQFIRLHGEQAFRDAESKIVKEAAAKEGSILAIGGGSLLRSDNLRTLQRNGLLVFLDRDLPHLTARGDRPLSATRADLEALYHARYAGYLSACDVRVDANGSIEEVTQAAEHALQAASPIG